MKSSLVLDQYCNSAKAPDYLKSSIRFKAGLDGKGNPASVPYYPKGTVFEGAQALYLCRSGQAEPVDDECKAAVNMSPEELANMQLEYRMTDLGIKGDDRELFRAGVITGYRRSADGSIEHIPGPKWDEYQAAKLANEQAALEEDI